ncbi:Phosphatidylinositol-specific phospholipase C, X domain containing [Nesidiocoris tenuis]|uniref:Phosphatidylinositol-specific phospholipase C, X domain containing n=1 Tax=Nesidiocoris tenuis TaxID=355587 RepID=A0ABN7AVL8_9HEMI|nr:Phosphatidylinositol-specific phospholipase C, X domain containing [Nesidiocoris tenuis]
MKSAPQHWGTESVGLGKKCMMTMLMINLSNWMTNLPDDVKKRPLRRLSIPGSHNSGTCDLSRKAGNDAFCMNIPAFARPWSKCQRDTIKTQLEFGIRYLDIRLDFDDTKSAFYITHFLRSKSHPIQCMETVKTFLDAHPEEVVIVDFQHYYHFSLELVDEFLTCVVELFGRKICPVPTDADSLTLQYLQENHYQVLLINRYQCRGESVGNSNLFFRSTDFPTFWPNTDDGEKVIDVAKEVALNRIGSFGYITQLVLTAQGPKNFVYLSLKSFHTSRLWGKAMAWLRSLKGGSQPSIVITDFIDYQNYTFPITVIMLNYLKDGEIIKDNMSIETASLESSLDET